MSRWKLAAAVVALAALPAEPRLSAQTTSPLAFTQVNQPGFGNSAIDYSWSGAWFNGKLYIGTNKNFHCLQAAEFALVNPNPGPLPIKACEQCPANFNNLDLRGEIWSYTPTTHAWARVYQSPTVPNPAAPGQTFAQDVGYRGMIVYTEADGTQALYVGGVTARDLIPALPGPRILRSTDGVTFTPIPFSASTGTPNIVGFRGMQSFNGQLFVIGTTNLDGYGVVLASPNPAAGGFTLVSSPSLAIYEIQAFNNHMYFGTSDATNGYSVLKTSATGTPPYATTTVVCCGGGVGGAQAASVVTMQVFNNRLYVGTAPSQSKDQNAGHSPFYGAELIRVATDDSWQLVMGSPRIDPISGVYLTPLSGFGDGFGNFLNKYIWSMEVHNSVLYVGTYDANVYEASLVPFFPALEAQAGFDLFSTSDGSTYTQLSHNGLNVPDNFGARTMVTTPVGLFLGSANDCQGTNVFLGNQPPSSSGRPGSLAMMPPPRRLGGETAGSSAVLSWDPTPGAAKFQIYRTTSRSVSIAQEGEIPWSSKPTWVQGPTEWVGTSTSTHFEAPAPLAGERSTYYIRAEDEKGRLSGVSNGISVTPTTHSVTFEGILTDVEGLATRRKVDASGAARLRSLLEAGLKAAQAGDLAGVGKSLERLETSLTKGEVALSPVASEDLAARIELLKRRVKLVEAGVLPAKSLGSPQ